MDCMCSLFERLGHGFLKKGDGGVRGGVWNIERMGWLNGIGFELLRSQALHLGVSCA